MAPKVFELWKLGCIFLSYIFSFSSLLCDLDQPWVEELRSYWKGIIWLVESQGHQSSQVSLYQLFKHCKLKMFILITDIDIT